MYQSTKTFGHDVGLSCAFRQWRAHSHCRFIHGYSLAIKFTFETKELDNCGWVVDFGGLKALKTMMEGTFDHKLLVAEDDPWLPAIRMLAGPLPRTYSTGGDHQRELKDRPAADIVVVPATGCEAFARLIYECTEQWLLDAGFAPRCRLVSVQVSEHGANSATYLKD